MARFDHSAHSSEGREVGPWDFLTELTKRAPLDRSGRADFNLYRFEGAGGCRYGLSLPKPNLIEGDRYPKSVNTRLGKRLPTAAFVSPDGAGSTSKGPGKPHTLAVNPLALC
jgi:hypothetical protein